MSLCGKFYKWKIDDHNTVMLSCNLSKNHDGKHEHLVTWSDEVEEH